MSNKTKQRPLKEQLSSLLNQLIKYKWVFLILFFLIIYVILGSSIQGFINQQPSASMVSADLKTTVQPNINPKLVNKLKQLNNNSVSVQALFNQSRQNPFQ